MNFCYSCMKQLEGQNKPENCPYCGEPIHISYDASRYLKPGSVLQGKFIVGKSLGSGGFGNTYIGWNQVLKCRVAIKEYFPGKYTARGGDGVTVSGTDTVSQQRFRAGLHQFLEEARNIATLQDVKGVVQVYTFFEENGTGYIIMEYLDGMSVREIIKKKNERLDYTWSRNVVLTVLHTLREIHQRGVLHRDIAPDNILVTWEGVIKLIDFGAAKNAAAVSNPYGEIVLKNGYAPIEQYSRHTEQGPYTDLYAVAALFYYMLSGVKPPAANERVQSDTLKSLSEMGVSVPEETELAIMVCLNIQPEYRLQSAQEFMDALGGQNFQPVYEPNNLPDFDTDDTSVKRFKNWFGGMKAWQKAGVVCGVTAFLGGVVFLGVMVSSTLLQEDTEVLQVENQKLPDYMGQSLDEVQKELEGSGLSGEVTYHYQAERAEDTVVNVEPPAGSFVKEGDVISLEVESSEWVTLPDYKEWNEADIEKSLKERLSDRYRKEIFGYQYASVKKGACVSQTSVGKVALEDTEDFQVWISWGEQSDYEKKMPDLRGKTVKQAEKLLQDAGLDMKLVTKEVYSDKYVSGQVCWQEITKGKQMNTNIADKKNYSVPEKVEVTVSKGVKPTPTPRPTPTPKPARTKAPEKPAAPSNPKPKPTPKPKKPASKNNDAWEWEEDDTDW